MERSLDTAVMGEVVTRQANRRNLADRHMTNFLRQDLNFDHQLVVDRHDLHDGLSRRYDATDRLHHQVFDHAMHRGCNLQPFKTVFQLGQTLIHLRELGKEVRS